MLQRAALVSLMKVALVMLLILDTGSEAAPTTRGFLKPTHLHHRLTSSSTPPEKSSSLNLSRHLKHWLQSTKAATPGVADRTGPGSIEQRGTRTDASPDKRAQMLKVISGLEALHSTLSSRITFMPRGKDATKRSGRISGRKAKKVGLKPPINEGGEKPTTLTPAAAESAASRASTDVLIPSLTGRNFKKSLPPQIKKTNKRVCFWKYCSQN